MVHSGTPETGQKSRFFDLFSPRKRYKLGITKTEYEQAIEIWIYCLMTELPKIDLSFQGIHHVCCLLTK